MKVSRKGKGPCVPGIALFVFILEACVNQFLPEPRIIRTAVDSGDTQKNDWGAPQNVTITQGKKRAISLSWEPVEGAVRYNIYKSESPLLEFTLAGQTGDDTPGFEFITSPGTSLFYKVEAADERNRLSPQSDYVFGTSLAQPVISDVASDPATGITQVHWYMNNVEAYQDRIRYVVSCFENLAVISQETVDGSSVHETSAVFGGLSSNTAYSFQVKAYLAEDEDAAEYSETVDAVTARITRPGAPLNLNSLKGGGTTSIALSFELPGTVYVLSSENKQYEEHPLYFEIRRKAAGSSAPFQIICSYFGSDQDKKDAGDSSAALFSYDDSELTGYVPGALVSWTDTSIPGINRGVDYEYQVQSYVDGVDRKITSSSSAADTLGWTMISPRIAFEDNSPVYTENETGGRVRAVLPLQFEHETKGVEYAYKLIETIAPLGDGLDNGFTGASHEYPKTVTEIDAYQADIDLTASGSPSNKGRGVYSYAVEVRLDETLVETVYTIGSRRVTEDKTSIVVENFEVKDGYPDKFKILWKRYGDRAYVLEYANQANPNVWTVISEFGADTSFTGNDFSYEYSSSPGKSLYFRISAKEGAAAGEYYYSAEVKTLGVPVLSGGGLSYDKINLIWAPVQMADAYRIIYTYDDAPGTSYSEELDSPGTLPFNHEGKYVYGFSPQGYNDARRAGKPLTVRLEALNKARQSADGGAEIKTGSNSLGGRRVFGPADVGSISITKDTSPSEITLSWQGVSEAAGYYIVRCQLKMDGSGLRTGDEVFYYVNAATLTIRGKELLANGDDTANVSAEINRDVTTYTLRDKYMTDSVYASRKQTHGFYADEQNDMAWGYPYTYYVLPVLSENDKPSFNYSANTCTLGEVTYINSSIDTLKGTGRLFGFGEKVTAAKGSAVTEINGEEVNDRIEVRWEEPARFKDGKTKYYLYRKLKDSPAEWTLLTPSPINESSFTDNLSGLSSLQAGLTYEYCVGITRTDGAGSSHPEQNARYLDECRATMDEDFPEESQMAGYVLGNSTLVSVSRDIRGDENSGYYETIVWNCAGIDNNSFPKKNRGITGYEIQVKNNDDGGNWKTFKQVNAGPDALSYTENLDNSGGLLKVLRDYRHYFRVRTYYESEGNRVYSVPPPDPDYGAGQENYWVKWGARQITKNEFAMATSLAIGSALRGITQGGYDPSGCNTQRNLSPVTPVFPNISGTLYAASSRKWSLLDLGYVPDKLQKYGAEMYTTLAGFNYDYRSKPFTLTFTGALSMYTGTVYIDNLDSGGGTYRMNFNGFGEFTADKKFFLKPFTFGEAEFKNCDSLDGNGTGGWL